MCYKCTALSVIFQVLTAASMKMAVLWDVAPFTRLHAATPQMKVILSKFSDLNILRRMHLEMENCCSLH
jgi:hypothetical protein